MKSKRPLELYIHIPFCARKCEYCDFLSFVTPASAHRAYADKLIEEIKKLNQEIRKDKSLGKGFCIGHSYFCGCKRPGDCTDAWLQSIVDYDILPMLEEYWFDDESAGRLREWQDRLHKAIAPKADGVSQ